MSRSFALVALWAGSFTAGLIAFTSAGASPVHKPHYRTTRWRVAAVAPHHMTYRMSDVLTAAYARGAAGPGYALRPYGEARPRLTFDRAFGGGATGSIGLEHADNTNTIRDINGVTMSVPPPPSSLVGAKVSYPF